MHDASPFGDVFLNTDEVIFETHTELTQQTCKCALRLSCIPYWTLRIRVRYYSGPHGTNIRQPRVG